MTATFRIEALLWTPRKPLRYVFDALTLDQTATRKDASRWEFPLWLLGFVALCGIYGPLILRDPKLTRDDRSLLAPIEHVHSFADYLEARRSHQILDLQPVRDLAFWSEIQVSRWFGRSVFHLTNFVVWLGIVALAWLVVRRFFPRPMATVGVTLFAVHPVFVGSVAWISAIKHLLACLFVLLATTLFLSLRERQRFRAAVAAVVVVCYALGVASQPIIVLWPLWAGLVLVLERAPIRDNRWAVVVGCLLVMTATLAANYTYYTHGYVTEVGAAKLVARPGTHVGIGWLALGRYVANFVLPVALSAVYDPRRWLNVFGLVVLVLAVLASLRWLPKRRALIWWAFFLFPIVIVTAKMTNVFASDTYVVTSGVGVLSLVLLAAVQLVQRQTLRPRVLAVLGVVVGIGFTAQSMIQARSWLSDEALWAQAYTAEPTATTAAKHAFFLVEARQADAAVEVLQQIPPAQRNEGEYPMVFAQAVAADESLSLGEKIRLLESSHLDAPWFDYRLAALDASAARFDEADRHMRAALRSPNEFQQQLPTVVAEAYYFCRRVNATDCDQRVRAARQSTTYWNERAFQRRLSSLGLTAPAE